MLEPVALHQTRFNAPGIAPDARGIVLGRQGAVLFTSLDALVGWFRILSDEVTLDDLLPSLSIIEARSAVESLAFVVLFHAETSYLLDRAARVASLLGALSFTGSGKHFVKYRDAASPLGYDVETLAAEPGDLVLYSDSFVQPLRKVRDIAFQQLVFRLSPRKVPGARLDEGERALLWLAVAPGLAASVLTYLHRNRVATAATMVEREGGRSAFGERRRLPSRYLLVRVRELPARILALMQQVPGIAAYLPVVDNVAVEAGYRHPFNLEACRSVFQASHFYLFSGAAVSDGAGGVVDVVAPPRDGAGALLLVDGEKLVAVGFDLGEPLPPPRPAHAARPPGARVSLRLVPSLRPPRRVTGALLGWEHAEQLKQLVFALPPTVLSHCRVAAVLDGLLVLGSPGLDIVPLGEPLYEAAPSIFVPVGWELLPRIDDAILADRVGGVEGRVVVFRRGADAPIAVEESAFEPLGRKVVGRLDVETGVRSPRAGEPRPLREPSVTNDPAGAFPLWGYRDR
jgi:hypothetical protein